MFFGLDLWLSETMDTVSVFSLLEGVVFCLSVMAGIIWLRQRRMRGLYNACKEGNMETVEKELAKGVGDEELGIALMWASSTGKAKVVGRLLKERSSLTSQKFSLASCLMCACKRGHVKVVELLVQEEAVLLDVKNKNGLKPEEVTHDSAIRELLREEHWRRARSEVGREAELLEQQERNEVEILERQLEKEKQAIKERFTREAELLSHRQGFITQE